MLQWRGYWEIFSFKMKRQGRRNAYAHTWLPCSGTTVKRSWSFVSCNQTSLPREERDAVRPIRKVSVLEQKLVERAYE